MLPLRDPSAVPLHRRHRSRRDRPPRRRRRRGAEPQAGVTSPAPRLAELLASRHVIVLRHGRWARTVTVRRWPSRARRGCATVVVTIDPAMSRGCTGPRAPAEYRTHEIARAMGRRRHRRASGSLHALMLDPKSTFDHLVAEYARDEEQAQRILENAPTGTSPGRSPAPRSTWRWRSCTSSTSVRLRPGRGRHATHAARCIPSTCRRRHPPARQPVFRRSWPRPVLACAVGAIARRPSVRTVSKWWAPGHRRRARLLRAFEGMEEGFRSRANETLELLASERSAPSSSPPAERRSGEAEFFADRLADGALAVEALVVNRVHPLRGRAVRRAASPRDRAPRRGGGAQRRGRRRRCGDSRRSIQPRRPRGAGDPRGRELHGLGRASATPPSRTCPSSITTCTTSPRSCRRRPPRVIARTASCSGRSPACDRATVTGRELDPRRRRQVDP